MQKISLLNGKKRKKPFVSLVFIYLCLSLTVAALAQANMALNRPRSTLFYHDTSLIGSRSSLVCFSTSFKTHLLKKRAVKAAKSSRSPSRPVVIHLRRICSRVFCIHYFLKTKPGSRKTITEKCFSCQKKSVCQKLACSCKK